MSRIKLGIAEDHRRFRETIVQVLNQENDFEVILEVSNGKELINQLHKVKPDIILLDIRMPEMDGIETAEKLRHLYPQIKIIALSQHDFEENIIEMNIRGVKSFIGKGDEPEELFKAIRIVHHGGVYMTNHSAEIVQRYLLKVPKHQNVSHKGICENEKELIRMILEGLTSKEISKKINRSHRTVEDMRERLYVKFEVKNKEQLILLVSRWNLN